MILCGLNARPKHRLGDSEDMKFIDIEGLLRHSRSSSMSHCSETRQLAGLLKPTFPRTTKP
jgi:hypothetical protein